MTTIEDRVRAAATAAADTVEPGSAPSLRLPAEPGRRSRRVRRGSRERWTRRIAPLAAAVAVIAVVAAVVAASLAFSSGTPGHRPQGQAAHGSALAGLPPYYVMLTGRNPDPTVLQPLHAVIRATATGATASTITAPSPYSTFIKVAGAADGRTFVLAAEKLVVDHVDGGASQPGAPVKFFLLRIPAAGRASLTALPIPPEPPSAGLTGIALSPDGRKLAVAADGGPSPRIQVFSTATGAEHDWTWPGGGRITNNASGRTGQVLSWAADDRTVAFQLRTESNIYIGVADTATPGSGRLVVKFAREAAGSAPGGIRLIGTTALITPGANAYYGHAIVLAGSWSGPQGRQAQGFMEFSAKAGQPMDVFNPGPYPGIKVMQAEDVLWTNASDSRLIVIVRVPAAKPGTSRLQIGAVTKREGKRPAAFTPLPGPQFPSEAFSYPAW
jgi:hypothetical protein